jgi:hypothetical protein
VRYFVYILGFVATLLAVFFPTLAPDKRGVRRITPTGYLAGLLALAVLVLSTLGTCSDQSRIKALGVSAAPLPAGSFPIAKPAERGTLNTVPVDDPAAIPPFPDRL